MPEISPLQAVEKLAAGVETAEPGTLAEIYSELHPEQNPIPALSAAELARQIRAGLDPEEIVDLWNVVFPSDRCVWYNEEDDQIHFNEEAVGLAE